MAITQSDGWRDSGGSGGERKKQGVVGRKEGRRGRWGSKEAAASRLGQDERESVSERRYGWRSGRPREVEVLK